MPAKREVMSPKGNKRYVRRDAKGRIREVDDMGRSLSQDRRRKARKTTTKGQGDKGDRATARTGRKRAGAARRKRALRLPAHRAPIVA